jgi:hypothetical protein
MNLLLLLEEGLNLALLGVDADGNHKHATHALRDRRAGDEEGVVLPCHSNVNMVSWAYLDIRGSLGNVLLPS